MARQRYCILKKISIIEYFLNNKKNQISVISNKLNIPPHRISETINEYYKNNKCLITESKVNRT